MHILQVVHNSYFYAPLFTEFELQKVFENNGNRTSNNENINKVHDLPGHASYFKICNLLQLIMITNNDYPSPAE